MRTLWERLRQEMEAEGQEVREASARQLKFLCQFAWLHPELGPDPPSDDGIRRNLLAALFNSRSRFAAFTLTDLFGAEIRFTTNGSLPTANNGFVYTNAITIDNTPAVSTVVSTTILFMPSPMTGSGRTSVYCLRS